MMLQSRIFTFISSIFFSSLLLTMPCQAQSEKKMIPLQKDSVAFFRGVAAMVDIVGPLQLALGDYGQYEAGVRINLKDKFFPVAEIGYGKADAEDAATRVSYKTSAPYGRIGMDFNLLKNKHSANRVYGDCAMPTPITSSTSSALALPTRLGANRPNSKPMA